jgi:hypothetical protein
MGYKSQSYAFIAEDANAVIRALRMDLRLRSFGRWNVERIGRRPFEKANCRT